jgi:DNA-binding transcriptional LysR family regulator
LRVQIAVLVGGIGVALLPEPSVKAYGLVPLKIGSALRRVAEEWPSDELFLVTHRALREVPRVEAVWQLLVERVGGRPG